MTENEFKKTLNHIIKDGFVRDLKISEISDQIILLMEKEQKEQIESMEGDM